MNGPPAAAEPPSGELTPAQRARIQRRLEGELTEAWRAAVAAGVDPVALADAAERARAVCSRMDLGDDPEHLVDDPPDGRVIGEQD